MAKILISLGLGIILLGMIWLFGDSKIPLGRLPGDIVFQNGRSQIHVPIMTCILVSVAASLILKFIRYLRR